MTAADLEHHVQLGIDLGILQDAQVRRVTDEQARALGLTGPASRDCTGLAYMYVDPDTGRPVTCRVRRDRPEMEDGRPRDKYLAPYGDRRHLYLSAMTDTAVLADTTIPVVLVEAEKSALVLASVALRTGRALVPVAMGGCYGWRGRIGRTETPDGARTDETGPLPDLDRFTWTDRDVIILLDYNVVTNSRVQQAERQLADDLARRGARVRLARLPEVPGVNGPDDYRAQTDDAAVLAVLDAAQPARIAYKTAADHLAAARLDALVEGVVPADLETRLRRLADSVRGVDALRRRLVRDAAIAALRAAKVPGAAGLVDAALHTVVSDVEQDVTLLADDAPHPLPVDGAALLDQLAETIRRYVVLPTREAADAVALWLLLAWSEAAVSILPILSFVSPTPRCGKSTAVAVVGALAPRALLVSGITPAALFRSVEVWHPTLLIDEADTVLPGNEDLRGVLNAGHTRHAAVVIRCVGDDQTPTRFSVWCPKVLALIGRPPTTVLDRSILVELRRKTPADSVSRLRLDTIVEALAPLRQQCRRWADDNAEHLRGADPALPGRLHDRAMDNWRGMVAIADLAGDDWPSRARKAAEVVSGVEDDGDVPIGVLLLTDIREVWPANDHWLATSDLLGKLLALDDRPWPTFGRQGSGLTQHKLASILRDFRVYSTPKKDASKKHNVYLWSQVSEAISRYVPKKKDDDTDADDDGSIGSADRSEPRNPATESRQKSRSASEPVPDAGSDLKTQNRLRRVAKFRGSETEAEPIAGRQDTDDDGGHDALAV